MVVCLKGHRLTLISSRDEAKELTSLWMSGFGLVGHGPVGHVFLVHASWVGLGRG